MHKARLLTAALIAANLAAVSLLAASAGPQQPIPAIVLDGDAPCFDPSTGFEIILPVVQHG